MSARLSPGLLALLLLTGPVVAEGFPGYDQLRARAESLWTGENPRQGAYLVLLPEGSPLEPAARRLARHRRAEIVAFDPARPEDSLEDLIRLQARHLAIFVEPAQMDVNLLRRFIVLSTLLDEDPFCDVAFGFFTGSTPGQVEQLVRRSIAADRRGVKPRTARWAVSNISHTYQDSSFIDGLPGASHYVSQGDLEYARQALGELREAGFVHLGGCGDPEGIWLFDDDRNRDRSKHWPYDPGRVGEDPAGEMPRILASDLRKIRLDGAVVWTHVCHIGSVGRVFVEGDIVSTFGRCEQVEAYQMPAERSVGLALLGSGLCAYIAPLGPNFGAQSNIEQAIASETGIPLGDVLRRAYHDVVMDTGGHPEQIGLYEAGKPRRWEPDLFTNHNSPHHRCLYGDPLLAPFGKHRSPPTVTWTTRKRGADLLAVTFRVARSGPYLGRTWYGNRGQQPGRGRIYESLPLSGSPRSVAIEQVVARTAAGEPFELVGQQVLLEQIDGRTLLHLQVVTGDPEVLRTEGSTVEVLVRLGAGEPVVTPEPPPTPAPPPDSPPAAPAVGAREEGYVILTCVPEGDPYDAAVRALQGVHPEATLLRFEGSDPGSIREELRELAPRFVVLVLRPEHLDINLQGRVLQLCTGLDEDPFCDFSFGYVTGATATEAVAFVETIRRAREVATPRRLLVMPTVGGAPPSRSETTGQSYGVDWPAIRLAFGEEEGHHLGPEAIRAHLEAHRADLEGNGAIMMGGHGSPISIAGNISGRDLRAVQPDLFPAVIYNYACMTGCTGTCFQWYDRGDDMGRYRARPVPPQESLCLAVLSRGAAGYVASLEPRPAGPGMSTELWQALCSGRSLGEVRRREYDLLVLAFLARGEAGLVVPSCADGQPRRRADAVRDIMMMDASGAVLFGDPSLTLEAPRQELVTTSLTSEDAGHLLTCILQQSSGILCFDPYRSWPGGRQLASKLHAVVELPPEMPAVTGISVRGVTGPDGTAIEHAFPVWAIERVGELRRLHVQVSAPPRALSRAGTQAVFRINPDPGEAAVTRPPPSAAGERSELTRGLEEPWHLGKRAWTLQSFLTFVESYLDRHAEQTGWARLHFEFAAEVKEAASRTVTLEADRTPFRKLLESICTQLGLGYEEDHETGTVRFVPGDGKAPPTRGTEPGAGPTTPAPDPGWAPEPPGSDTPAATAAVQRHLRAFEQAGQDLQAQYEALWAIAGLRTPAALRALSRLLEDSTEEYLQDYLVGCIARVDGARAAGLLLTRLARTDGVAHQQALARALLQLGTREAAGVLLQQGLGHRSPLVREVAARALGATRWGEAVSPLVAATRDRNLGVRVAAIEALGRLAFPDALEQLLRLARQRDEEIATTALWALEESASRDPRIPGVVLELIEEGQALGPRIQATRMAGRQRLEGVLEGLLGQLDHRSWSLRSATLQTLATLRSPRAIEPLLDRLSREEGRLQAEVARALHRITGVDYGTDVGLWRSWWAEHRKGFQLPPDPGSLRDSVPETVLSYHTIPVESTRLLFLLDVSSSMTERVPVAGRGEGAPPAGSTRLAHCQWELCSVLRKLGREVRFNLITFESAAHPWEQRVVPATPASRRRACEFVEAQQPVGGTNLSEALELAFQDPGVDTIYLLSDGQPAGSTADILRWVRRVNAARGVVIHTISAGALRGSDFLQRMAAENGGTHVTLD